MQHNINISYYIKSIISIISNLWEQALSFFKSTCLPSPSDSTGDSDHPKNVPKPPLSPFLYRVSQSQWLENTFNAFCYIYIYLCDSSINNLFKPQETKPKHAVLFAHGLRGNVANFYLLMMHLTSRSKRPDFLKFNSKSSDYIQTNVNNLVADIIEHCKTYDHITLIGHSRGSILVDDAYNQLTEDHPEIAEKVFGVISMAAPEKNIEIVTLADLFFNGMGRIGHLGHLLGLRFLLSWLICSFFEIAIPYIEFSKEPRLETKLSNLGYNEEETKLHMQNYVERRKYTGHPSPKKRLVFLSLYDFIVGNAEDQVPTNRNNLSSYFFHLCHAGHMSILQDTKVFSFINSYIDEFMKEAIALVSVNTDHQTPPLPVESIIAGSPRGVNISLSPQHKENSEPTPEVAPLPTKFSRNPPALGNYLSTENMPDPLYGPQHVSLELL